MAVLVVVGLAAQSVAALAAVDCIARIAEWPVRFSPGNTLLIDGAINGHNVDIALDTGAMFTIIMRSEALRLGLKPSWTRGFRMSGVGGETEVEHVLIDEFRIGQATRKDWYMFVAGEQDMRGAFSVLLGDDFFHRLDVEFDLANNAVRLYQSNGCGGASLAYWAKGDVGEVAIEPFNERQPRIFVKVKISGQPVRALLDSGAANSLLDKTVAARLGAKPGAPGVLAAGKVNGLGKSTLDAWIARFESFVIGNEAIKDTAILFADLPPDVPMLLGADFLRAHRLLVAHSQQKVYFTYTGGPVFQLAKYDAVLWMNPKNATALVERGNALTRSKDYDKAIEEFDSAIGINPKLAEAFVGRGNAWRAKGDLDRAVADYDAALGIDPRNALALANRGSASYDRKDYGRAIGDLDRAIEIDSKLAQAYVIRGNAKRRTGSADDALVDYALAIQINPKLATAYNQLAWELATSERPAVRDGRRAVESALKACELTEWKNPNYIDTLAAAYARAGDFEAAIKWQRKAIEDPGFKGFEEATKRLHQYEEGKAFPRD
jgi:tetratricopeptide (TPR) repeat protein/predicted aspartyl protease